MYSDCNLFSAAIDMQVQHAKKPTNLDTVFNDDLDEYITFEHIICFQ